MEYRNQPGGNNFTMKYLNNLDGDILLQKSNENINMSEEDNSQELSHD